MTNTYNTGNPLGSTSPKDLYDNASDFDDAMNSELPSFYDRFNKRRETWAGMQKLVTDFLEAMGFEATHLVYVDGTPLTVLRPTQLIDRTGSVYKVKMPATFPVNLTGTWATDQLLLVDVGDASLRMALALDTGAGMIGFDESISYPDDTIGQALQPVESVFALLSEPTATGRQKRLSSYHTGWAVSATFDPKGGGTFVYDPSILKSRHDGGRVISPTVPWDGSQAALSTFLDGTGETLPGGSGCWIRVQPNDDVFEYGARGDNVTNDIASFQKPLDSIRRVNVPNASYSLTGTLLYKTNGCCLLGESMTDTKLNFTGAGPALRNPDSATITRLFCELKDLNINAPASGNANVVDWKSIQFGIIDRVWILGQPILGNCTLNMEATWIVTECTYNSVTRCYMGNTSTCIRVGDGANNNTVFESRFQPGGTMPGPVQLTGAIGILLSASSAERISNFNIISNGFEYPFNLATGINVLQNCNGVFMKGNRFEQLANGIVVGAVGNRHIQGANRQDNYFDSCTTNINLSTGARAAAPAVVASGSYTGTGALTEIGTVFGMTAVRTGVGSYAFSFLDTDYPDSGYVVQITASEPIVVVSKSSTGFTVVTQNVSVANTDSSVLDVTVFYNR